MIQEDINRLKKSGFKVERTPTGYVFTLEPGDKFGDLYAGKEECEVIQKIGKIVEMSFALLFLGQLLEGVK